MRCVSYGYCLRLAWRSAYASDARACRLSRGPPAGYEDSRGLNWRPNRRNVHGRCNLRDATAWRVDFTPESFTIVIREVVARAGCLAGSLQGGGTQTVTEHDLVARCREGDREAQRELYDRTSVRVYRLLLKMTASPDDAFDLAQETYLKAFTRIGQFDGRSSVATWLFRVAVNEALQFRRRAGLSRVQPHENIPDDGVVSDIEQSAVRLDVNEALALLPPHDRAMLALRYQDGLDYRAIAEVVGCAAGTVASRLNRAREGLREILRKSYTVEEERSHDLHPNSDGKVPSETGHDGKQGRIGT